MSPDVVTSLQQAGMRSLPLRQFLTYRLAKVLARLNAQANTLLKQSAGLTLAQWRVMALIAGAGETRLSDLAKDGALDKGLLSRNIKALVALGLVAQVQHRQDQRVQLLRLSKRGQAVFDETLPMMLRRQVHLANSMEPDELDVFLDGLDKLEAAAAWLDDGTPT